MINGQYPLQMWLRGMSLGLYVACAGLLPKSSFPITTTLLVICWVIAGIYGKWRREEEEKEREERMRKRERKAGDGKTLRLIACPHCHCRQQVNDSLIEYQCLNCKEPFDPSVCQAEATFEDKKYIKCGETAKPYVEFKVEKMPYKPQPMISYLLKVIPTVLAVIVLLWLGDKGGFFVYIAIAGWVAAWIINMHERAKVDRYNQAQLDKRKELRK